MNQEKKEHEQARLLLARLLFTLKKEVRWVTFWGVIQTIATVLYILLVALLLSSLIGVSKGSIATTYIVVAAIFTLLARAFSFYKQEQNVLFLTLQSEALALKKVTQGWRCAAGTDVAREQASVLGEPLQAIGPYFARFRPQLVLALVGPLLVLAIAFWLDWIAGLFLLLSAPLIPVFMALVGMGADRVNQQHFALMRRISGLFIDRLRNITVLKLFNQTQQAQHEVERASDKSHQLNMKTLRVAFLSSAVLEFFSAIAIAAVAIYVGFALLGYYQVGPASQMTWFVGLAVLMLAPEFFQPLRTLSSYYHDRAAAIGAAAELARYGLHQEQGNARQSSQLQLEQSQFVVNELNVSYEGRGVVLKNINLTALPGHLTWIFGESGSGKSTLLKSVVGLFDKQTPSASTQAVAYLAQSPFIANQSLADNLRLAAPDATEQQLSEALVQVGLADLLHELPEGLHTRVGTQGAGLSGGEGRRVAIARVLLSDARLVLLDEPTAGLDKESATEVMQAVQCLLDTERIVIVSSHDSILADWATQTFELKEGQLHEV